ncbi:MULTISPECIES: hypothetical protein [Streptomyces]|uniref:Uncharacterized protein n=1 Tax=Streptomyces solicathayae TaxID=3081768 RepID=A0ABZ0LU83_9ACTN|nr:hypothetical protein [Streptomyces sp. HUAS YS2]WOX23065.1 hypothetical protein R2D22_17350 [Streptomyces sp. HUAS YS2]
MDDDVDEHVDDDEDEPEDEEEDEEEDDAHQLPSEREPALYAVSFRWKATTDTTMARTITIPITKRATAVIRR